MLLLAVVTVLGSGHSSLRYLVVVWHVVFVYSILSSLHRSTNVRLSDEVSLLSFFQLRSGLSNTLVISCDSDSSLKFLKSTVLTDKSHKYTAAHTRMRLRIRTFACTQYYTYKYTHVHKNHNIQTNTHTNSHARAHIHIYIHTLSLCCIWFTPEITLVDHVSCLIVSVIAIC